MAGKPEQSIQEQTHQQHGAHMSQVRIGQVVFAGLPRPGQQLYEQKAHYSRHNAQQRKSRKHQASGKCRCGHIGENMKIAQTGFCDPGGGNRCDQCG